MWLKWSQMRLCGSLREMMSKRYTSLLVVTSILKRLGTSYHIIGGDEPEDRDSVVVINSRPIPVYLLVTDKGIEYEFHSLNSDMDNHRIELLVSSAMDAIEALERMGYIDD